MADLDQLIRNSASHCASREAVADHKVMVEALRARRAVDSGSPVAFWLTRVDRAITEHRAAVATLEELREWLEAERLRQSGKP